MMNTFVNVYGIRTRIIAHGLAKKVPMVPLSADSFVSKDIILVIPGNPGLIGFYEAFMLEIFNKLNQRYHVLGVSHAGHDACLETNTYGCPSVRESPEKYTLDGQIKHKIDFVDEYIPRGSRICIVGHSIGSKIAIALLNHLEKTRPEYPKPAGYLLFPTIERMAETPQGRRLWPILGPLRTPTVYSSYLIHFMPDFIKDSLISWYFAKAGDKMVTSLSRAIKTIFNPNVLEKSLFMAHNELAVVRELDVEPLLKHEDSIRAYFGANDHWCPVEYHSNFVKSVPGIRAELCEHGYEHAFVINSSEAVAELVCLWLKEDFR